MTEKGTQIKTIWEELKNYLSLNIDYARLTMSEKLTVLMTAVALCTVAFAIVTLMMFFLSMAVVRWIAISTGMIGAYFIMTGFYALLLCVAVVFRKALIINPIARFITKLFFKS